MWEKINKFVYTYVILSALLLSAFFVVVVTVFGMSIMGIKSPYVVAVFTVGQLVLSVMVIWLMRKFQVFNIDDFKFKNIGKGLLLAWVGIVAVIINFFFILMPLPENSLIAPNPLHLLIVILHPLVGTGLFEEVLFRGLVLKLLLIKMGDSKKGLIKACVISSVVFAMVHLSNIIAYGDVLPFVSQIVVAIATGLFFAALFLRTRTLWIPILMHALLNLSVQIFDVIISPDILLQSNESQADTNILGFIVLTLVQALPFLISGIVLLKKVEPNEITVKESSAK